MKKLTKRAHDRIVAGKWKNQDITVKHKDCGRFFAITEKQYAQYASGAKLECPFCENENKKAG